MDVRHRKTGLVVIGLLAVTVLMALSYTSVAGWWIQRKIGQYAKQYHLNIHYSELSVKGISSIQLTGLVIVPQNADTLLSVSNMQVRFKLWHVLQGSKIPSYVYADSLRVSVVNQPQRSNTAWLSGQKAAKATGQSSGGYRSLAGRWHRVLHRIAGSDFEILHAHIQYTDSASHEQVVLPFISYHNGRFAAKIVNGQAGIAGITAIGLVTGDSASVHIQSSGLRHSFIPLLSRFDGLQMGCDSSSMTVQYKLQRNRVNGHVQVYLVQPYIRHWRLAEETVSVRTLQQQMPFQITDNQLQAGPFAKTSINDLPLQWQLIYSRTPQKRLRLKLHMPQTPAGSFFASLPQGMFNAVRDITATGTLQYQLQFELPFANPDSLLFESALNSNGLHITRFAADDLSRINGPFVYAAYDKGILKREIWVDPSNPQFTPLQQISPLLVQSVLQAEDPSFFRHNGFLAEAFRESMIKNMKEKRFARGGSTISMQLVKNVYLNRNKNIGRKVEEALIVYLIERLRLVPKERMLEVYLNVIEWGPGVYGITEAAAFYFNKTPARLTLNESIFLASIVPFPKYYMYQFVRNGQLRADMPAYYKTLAERMIMRQVLTPADTTGLAASVILTGPASGYLRVKD